MVKSARPVAFDVTNLVSRLPAVHPTGIDKVDLAYASHFSKSPCCAVTHYGLWTPRIHEASKLVPLLACATGDRWTSPDETADAGYRSVHVWLTGMNPPERLADKSATTPVVRPGALAGLRRRQQVRWRLSKGRHKLPADAIYLNVAQHAFEYSRFFSWLDRRPDVKSVFLVHDLLPLDYPEYFRTGYRDRFKRRVATILRHARGVITTTDSVAARLSAEYAQTGQQMVPWHTEPLPTSLAAIEPWPEADAALAAAGYFVIVGTIEPRKNHLLLLNLWRRLAETVERPPKLVILGARGWDNEQVFDVLDRSHLVRRHVFEAAGVGDPGLARLIQNARALLMPSFDEGYGMPVAEALSLGTPVIASDIPVFREVSQSRAIFRHPLDGPGWRDAILALSVRDNPLAMEAKAAALKFRPPDWQHYFSGVGRFLETL
jgi:glycosyltransferase involved in cell wall biosynthesis